MAAQVVPPDEAVPDVPVAAERALAERAVAERTVSTRRYAMPAARHRTEQVIDRSRFICTLSPVESVEAAQLFVRDIGREYPDATHNCWAYVVGPPGSTDRIGLSDDGEPHGTAGRPMLTVLQHCGLGDIAAVVTRYYGGTKLGTGGLVKAYSGAVQQALASAPQTTHVTRVQLSVVVGYAVVSAVKQLLPVFEAEVLSEAFGTDARFVLRCPDEQLEGLRRAVLDASRGQAMIETVQP